MLARIAIAILPLVALVETTACDSRPVYPLDSPDADAKDSAPAAPADASSSPGDASSKADVDAAGADASDAHADPADAGAD